MKQRKIRNYHALNAILRKAGPMKKKARYLTVEEAIEDDLDQDEYTPRKKRDSVDEDG